MEDEQIKKISRRDLDDIGKRNINKNSYRYRKFNGQSTMRDEYTGKTIHISSKISDNSNECGRLSTDITANTDHVVPIDEIKKKYEWMVEKDVLTMEDLKEITNSDYNLAETSEKLNKSKGGSSNHKYLIKKHREGSPESLNTSTINNMVQIARNEKDVGQAMSDIAKSTGNDKF